MTQETFRDTIFILRDEMYRFAKRFVLSNDEAEDVVQDLMMKFWQKKEQLAEFSNIKSYVFKSVKNECLNRLKHHEVKMNFASMTYDLNEKYHVEVNNLKETIIAWINDLPERQRLVIHLRDVEEYQISEIGEVLEMDENAVRVNLMRARQKIKQQIIALEDYEQRSISSQV